MLATGVAGDLYRIYVKWQDYRFRIRLKKVKIQFK